MKKGQWAQEREIREIQPLRNLKPLFDEEGNIFMWLLDRTWVVFGSCQCETFIMYSLFSMYMICVLFVLRPSFLSQWGCHKSVGGLGELVQIFTLFLQWGCHKPFGCVAKSPKIKNEADTHLFLHR
jgi:hypothetical protein